jgi:dipeptidyl-peptidase 4
MPEHPSPPSYPRMAARTQRFSLGVPNQFRVSPDGARVLFLRSRSGTDRTGLLWCLDVAVRAERVVLDPSVALTDTTEHLPEPERARRERLRQVGAGITAMSTDERISRAAVALSGHVFVVDVLGGDLVELPVRGAVDPQLSPDGRWVAYHRDGGLHVVPADGSAPPRALVVPDDPDVAWGLSDFAHAEELARHRAFWWSPDSTGLLVARVDESPVQVWNLSDPAHPERPARAVRYPVAGSPNVQTSLWHLTLEGGRSPVPWDTEASPYLADVTWTADGPALLSVLSRQQDRWQILTWEPGRVPVLRRALADPAWVDVVAGVPAWWAGRVLTVEVDAGSDTYRLCADGRPLTAPGRQVRAVLGVDESSVLLQVAQDERERRLARLWVDGRWEWLTTPSAVASGVGTSAVTVVRVDGPAGCTPRVEVRAEATTPVRVEAVDPPWVPEPRFLPRERPDDPRVAVIEPREVSTRPLPVLLDPYGGPHGQRVLAAARSYLESQWWAEQGYLVVVADGPGMPGSPGWERAMSGRFAEPALAAQVRAVEMVRDAYGERADLDRVAIRGWSFGGYLAALAVLERPDLVHAAVAGAPVADWRLYDTAYTERYLGLPADVPGRYESESLLERAPRLRRPLLLIHGFADDNVVVAHTLRLSQALLEAGRAHQVLPLSGVTHMTPQEVVAENLLLLQRDFLAQAIGPAGASTSSLVVPSTAPRSGSRG